MRHVLAIFLIPKAMAAIVAVASAYAMMSRWRDFLIAVLILWQLCSPMKYSASSVAQAPVPCQNSRCDNNMLPVSDISDLLVSAASERSVGDMWCPHIPNEIPSARNNNEARAIAAPRNRIFNHLIGNAVMTQESR